MQLSPACSAAELAPRVGLGGVAVLAHLLLEHSPVITIPLSRRPAIGNGEEMRMNHKYTIEALRELISVRRDSEQALRLCAASVISGPLGELCVQGAAECVDAARELEALVERLGGELQAHGAVAGFWRSGWAGLRAALARAEEGAILDACERGESWILEAYRNALDDHLPDFVRETVQRQFEVLMSTHEAFRGGRPQRAARGDAAAVSGAQAGQH